MTLAHATVAVADAIPTTLPDPPPRRGTPVMGPSRLPPSADLDGVYAWLGPVGAAARVDGGDWDSSFGGQLAVVRVREGAAIGTAGAAVGAALWSERDAGRVWAEAVIGTRIAGRMYGITAGPLVELAALQHPRAGGAVGVWAFFGVTPFARVGAIDEAGVFVEVGLHLALPVLRH